MRYAILLNRRTQKPAGIALETPDAVLVDAPDECLGWHSISAVYETYDEVFHPGDEGYFDAVLAELMRLVAVGRRGEL